jgi:hypothetical protein
MLDARGVSFNLGIAEVNSPDPRQPPHPIEYQIWRYADMEPIAAVSPPDATVADSIAELAQAPYALDLWHAPARALGQRLGVDALMSLLGVMVHPPTTPAGWDDWDWLIAIQIASALTLAYIDEGWEDSRRKAVLTSLIYGPMDWSGAAALIAMAVLARQNVRINVEFDRICCELWRIGRGSPEWPLEHAMIFGLIFVNAHSDEANQLIRDYFANLQGDQEAEAKK